jgi:starch phosphorylase
MTRLASMSEYINGVARRHAQTPEPRFWVPRARGQQRRCLHLGEPARGCSTLFPAWRHEPEVLVRADCCIPDDDLWRAHRDAKQALIDYVREQTGLVLAPHVPIVGCARRMTAYKRPDLLFSDLDRLRALARAHPFAVVMAGKAHPRDEGGKRLIQEIHRRRKELLTSPS